MQMESAKIVRAVRPYLHPEGINFKMKAYEAWKDIGGRTAKEHYPWRAFHHFTYSYDLPKFYENKIEARLRFVQPVSIRFDTFPDTLKYEIIPFMWDCWPRYDDVLFQWLEKYKIRTAIVTSSQVAEKIRKRNPRMNILWVPEGVDVESYEEGKSLHDRSIDILNIGRPIKRISKSSIWEEVNSLNTVENGKRKYSPDELSNVMGNSKVTICLPRCDTDPDIAKDIETLTQRYWECMISRIVMVGRAPQELKDLIGYNPVIDIDWDNSENQIKYILTHIDDYQSFVDKNRKTALQKGNWTIRMREVMGWLQGLGYLVR